MAQLLLGIQILMNTLSACFCGAQNRVVVAVALCCLLRWICSSPGLEIGIDWQRCHDGSRWRSRFCLQIWVADGLALPPPSCRLPFPRASSHFDSLASWWAARSHTTSHFAITVIFAIIAFTNSQMSHRQYFSLFVHFCLECYGRTLCSVAVRHHFLRHLVTTWNYQCSPDRVTVVPNPLASCQASSPASPSCASACCS